MQVAAISVLPRELNLVGPFGALDAAAQPVLDSVVASQTWVYALAEVDVQGWFLLAETELPLAAKAIVSEVTLSSRTDDAADVWASSFERPVRQDRRDGMRSRASHVPTAAGSTLQSALQKAMLDISLAALDVLFVTFLRGVVGDALRASA